MLTDCGMKKRNNEVYEESTENESIDEDEQGEMLHLGQEREVKKNTKKNDVYVSLNFARAVTGDDKIN